MSYPIIQFMALLPFCGETPQHVHNSTDSHTAWQPLFINIAFDFGKIAA